MTKFWSSWSHLQKDILFIVADIEEQVVSVILDLASPDSMDDYRTEAVAVSYFWENRIIPIIFIVQDYIFQLTQPKLLPCVKDMGSEMFHIIHLTTLSFA